MATGKDSKDFAQNFFQGSKGLWFVVMCLFLISAVAVYGALETSPNHNESLTSQFIGHLGWVTVSAVTMFVLHRIRPGYIMPFAFAGVFVMIVLLILCPFVGTLINGARRTIFGIQPSDFIKPCLIVFTAMSLAGGMNLRRQGKPFSWSVANYFKITPPKWFWVAVCGVVCALIMVENGSQAIMIGVLLLCMLVWAGVSIRQIAKWISPLFLSISVLFLTCYIQLDSAGRSTMDVFKKEGMFHRVPTMVIRIVKMFESKPLNETFDFRENEQANIGKVAVANSNVVGRGPLGNAERSVLPLGFSDFIYSVIVEMFGVGGIIVIFLLYGTLFFILTRNAIHASSSVYSLILFGIAVMFVVQALVNMLVGAGVFVTGQPLPLVSKGGTSMLVCAVMLGLAQSIIRVENEHRLIKVKQGKEEKKEETK